MSNIKYKSNLGSKLKKAASSPDASKLHVIAKNNGWIVKKEGSQKAQKAYKFKKEAVEGALITVRKGAAKAVIVHKKDGTIEAWKH